MRGISSGKRSSKEEIPAKPGRSSTRKHFGAISAVLPKSQLLLALAICWKSSACKMLINKRCCACAPMLYFINSPKKDLRWWTCGQWKMPCGGTHVRNTSEIGSVRLRRENKGKGKERIEVYLNK